MAIDLINEKQLKTFEIELQKTTFKKRFGGELGDFLESISITKIPGHENESIDFINKTEALKFFDLEIDALNSEILARKRATKPNLNLNLSANFYDIENRIANNHEVTGGLNLSIPMFDSGLVTNEVRSLLAQINIQKNNRTRKGKEFNLQFQELKNKMSKIRQENNTLDLKIENLSQKLEQLKLRSSSLEANGLEIAKIENKLASFFRTSMSLEWAAKKIELEKSVLFETILNGLRQLEYQMQTKDRQTEHWLFGPISRQKAKISQLVIASIAINIFALISAFYIFNRLRPCNTKRDYRLINISNSWHGRRYYFRFSYEGYTRSSNRRSWYRSR